MKFKRTEEEDFSLKLTPLIDVVFLLLIFFMVSTAFIDFSRRMDIELPETNVGAAADSTKIFEIEMTAKGDILLNGEKVTMESLPDFLKVKGQEVGRRSVVVRADKKVEHGNVVKVMGICREAGILDIGIAVQ